MSLLLLDGTLVPVVPPAAGAFAELVGQLDRAAQAHLGGGPIIYRPAVGELAAVPGIFDAQYVLAQGDPAAGVEVLGPAVFLRLEDLPTDPEHDEPTLTIGALDYRVTERRPDGIGGIVLALRLTG